MNFCDVENQTRPYEGNAQKLSLKWSHVGFLLISPLSLKDPVLAMMHCSLGGIGKQKPRYHVNQSNRRAKSIMLNTGPLSIRASMFSAIELSRIQPQYLRTIAPERGWGGDFDTSPVFLPILTSTRCHLFIGMRERSIVILRERIANKL